SFGEKDMRRANFYRVPRWRPFAKMGMLETTHVHRQELAMKLLPLSVILLGLTATPVLAQEQGPKPAVHAAHAMVSSALPMVTQAMLETLKKGGNALDAAMVGMLLQTVVEPQMTTMGGAMGFLYYDAKSAKFYYLDAELAHTAKGAPIATGWVQITMDGPRIE